MTLNEKSWLKRFILRGHMPIYTYVDALFLILISAGFLENLFSGILVFLIYVLYHTLKGHKLEDEAVSYFRNKDNEIT